MDFRHIRRSRTNLLSRVHTYQQKDPRLILSVFGFFPIILLEACLLEDFWRIK